MIILEGSGKHFSGGHDISSPEADHDQEYPRVASTWWSPVGRPGAEGRYAREHEVYLDMCRRWRDLPKPTIAKIHGACLAGGLALAWSCDLIVASEDAFFADAGARFDNIGIEYFAHPWQMGPRFAKEFLFTARRVSAEQALAWGMVNRVVPRDQLDAETLSLASEIAEASRLGLALTKKAINHAEDLMGLRSGMDTAFALHQLGSLARRRGRRPARPRGGQEELRRPVLILPPPGKRLRTKECAPATGGGALGCTGA